MNSRFRRRLAALFRRGRLDRELEEEMQLHLELSAEARVRAGLDPKGARRAFGNTTLYRERSREMWGGRWLDDLVVDLRYAARALRRSPAFALVAVASLALGIGANTAIFSVINAVQIRSLPVTDPRELVSIKVRHPAGTGSISYPMFLDLRERQTVFTDLLATSGQGQKQVDVVGLGRRLEQVRTARVSLGYFTTLGVAARYGRVFAGPSEDRAVFEAVISDSFWQRHFGREPSAVGDGLRMMIGNAPDLVDRVFTIVGVAPPEFFGETIGDAPEVWIPLASGIAPGTLASRSRGFIEVIGRLRPGVAEAQASSAVNVLYQRFLADEVASLGARSSVRPEHRASDYRIELESASRGLDRLRQQFSRPLAVLMAAVGAVLLIACSNLANLLLARSAARAKEMGVRMALGAGRSRLVRQLMTEGLMLSLAGGALGLGVAEVGSDVLVAMITTRPGSLVLDVGLDPRVLGFAMLLSVATAFAFGLAPAWRASAVDILASLKSSTTTHSAEPSTQRLRKALIVAQVALSLALVTGAGLLARSLQKLHAVDPGFDRESVLLVDVEVHSIPRERRPALYRQIEEEIRALPGVRSASLSLAGVFAGGAPANAISAEGHTPRGGPAPGAHLNVVSPEYFTTVGMTLAAGRGFTIHDTDNSARVAVVNETLARTFFGGQNPLGRRISNQSTYRQGDAIEIVGVVQDSKQNDLRRDTRSVLFTPLYQSRSDVNSIELRTHGNPLALAQAVRELVARADRDIELRETKTLEDHVDRSLVRERLLSKLSGFFGAVALALAAIGLYGILAYAVERRRREIGIRMALGAEAAQVERMLLGEALRLAGIGLLAGLPMAYGAGRLVESFLFGLQPTDPLTFGTAALVMLAVAIAAAYLPARRAARIDPITALRYE